MRFRRPDRLEVEAAIVGTILIASMLAGCAAQVRALF